MSVRNQVYESAWSDRWCLAGSVTTPAPLTPGSHSLKLTRRFDSLSPVFRSALAARSTIPVVEIKTPSGDVALVNATIVNISPPGPHGGRKDWIDLFSWSFGAGSAPAGSRAGTKPGKAPSTHEIEEIELTFAKITITHKKGSKGSSDDWSLGG